MSGDLGPNLGAWPSVPELRAQNARIADCRVVWSPVLDGPAAAAVAREHNALVGSWLASSAPPCFCLNGIPVSPTCPCLSVDEPDGM